MRLSSILIATLIGTTAHAAGPNNKITKGTPITLGQYCTAIKGSMERGCEDLIGDFERECEGNGMQFIDGNRNGRGPQARCVQKNE